MDYNIGNLALLVSYLQAVGLATHGVNFYRLKCVPSFGLTIYSVALFAVGIGLAAYDLLYIYWMSSVYSTARLVITTLTTLCDIATHYSVCATMFYNRIRLVEIFELAMKFSKRSRHESWKSAFVMTSIIIFTTCLYCVYNIFMEFFYRETTINLSWILISRYYEIMQFQMIGFALFSAYILTALADELKSLNSKLRVCEIRKDSLARLLEDFNDIREICKELNGFFGIPSLLTFLMVTLGVTYNIMLLVGTPLNVDWLIGRMNYVSFLCILAGLQVGAPALVQEQASKTCHISIMSVTQKESIIMVEYFCLLDLHDPIQFDAYEFFPLNLPMVTSIVGVTATYCIIFLQLSPRT